MKDKEIKQICGGYYHSLILQKKKNGNLFVYG